MGIALEYLLAVDEDIDRVAVAEGHQAWAGPLRDRARRSDPAFPERYETDAEVLVPEAWRVTNIIGL